MDRYNILNELAKSGSYFIYNLDDLYKHAKSLTSGAAKLFFACKANPLGSILSTLNNAGLCFDVSSEGELRQILSLGISGDKIIMTGPAKPKNLVRLGLEHQISTFVIESPSQLKLLQELTKDYSYKPNLLLRLQLEWENDKKSVLGGNQITPYGMDLETVKNLLPKITLPLLGFHVFQWGNSLSADNLRQIWTTTIKACKKLTTDFQVLDVGGGLGIPYKGENPLEWELVNDAIEELKHTHQLSEFWLEMGRYLTGPYGEYITSIVDVKQTYGKDILVLEGGINHLSRSALVGEAFPAELLRHSNAPLKQFALHGPLCTSLDFLGEHRLPSDISINDIIIFKQTGAYGFTESMPFFLCHKLPGEAVIENGNLRIIREPKSAEFWLK